MYVGRAEGESNMEGVGGVKGMVCMGGSARYERVEW